MYCLDASSIFICQNADLTSKQEKCPAPTKLSNASCILGRWKESFFMQAFRWWKSIQNCKPPSFFHTNTTALHQALWLGLMAPDSNISHRWFLTSSTNGGGIHLNCSLKEVSSVTFIICSVEWVQPNSAGSNENTSWYLARSWWAASTSLGAQESRPLKCNFSNNLPCLCLTVSLGVWGSWDSWAPSSNCSFLRGLGTGNAATALATGVFFQRVCKYALLFLTTMTAFLLPCLNLVYVFCTVRPCSKEPSSVRKACTICQYVLLCGPSLPSLVWHGKRRALWFPHLGCTLTGHSCLYQLPPFGHHLSPQVSSYAPCTTLAFAHSITKASTSASFITLMTQLMVGVPRMTGIWAAKFERSGITRAISSSS